MIKKLVAVTVLTVLGFAKGNAQEKIKFGAKAGFNIANVTGYKAEDGSVASLHLGVLAEIPISQKFSFQPEVMYSGQGCGIGSGSDDVLALNYLNVPLMGKYYVAKGLSLEAGPQVGFLLSADAEGKNVKDSFKTVDFGVNLGVGYKLENGINFGARYNFGLSDINNVEGVSDKYRNGTLQVSVGYFFF